MELGKEASIAQELALQAAAIIMGFYQQDMSVAEKEDKSPITEADLAANKHILKGLKELFPDDAILSEEAADDKARLDKSRVWTVDPLDGTKEFIKRNGEFTVNIALAIDGVPVVGVVCLPAKDEFYATDGEDVFVIKDSERLPIKVSDKDDFREMTLMKSRSHASEALIAIAKRAGFKDEKPAGSALKGCLVASGDADVYIRMGNTHEWDICALDAVIRAAGGVVTDLEGNPLKYNKDDTLVRGFVASNGKKHEALVGLIQDGQA
ncbi:3'(2'),5'-bisphosphate nucleotidase CysQ [Candidatus Woesearchaeota archaeon]|nr:3'(2'),5'-bisphosphate nucleotidase CysQ [Candidatus Woesearchaeota archaeon]